jgi:hypothetical protein
MQKSHVRSLEADIGQASEGVNNQLQTSAMIRTTPTVSRQPSTSRHAYFTNHQYGNASRSVQESCELKPEVGQDEDEHNNYVESTPQSNHHKPNHRVGSQHSTQLIQHSMPGCYLKF